MRRQSCMVCRSCSLVGRSRIDGFEDILLNPANPSIGFDESAAHWLAGLGAITETAAGALLIVVW